jgi:hypothetical protein
MASKPETPSWLEAVQRFERAIGEPIEAFVRSDAYFDLMTRANRARTRFTRVYEQAAEEWLHFFNMPAASDIRRLREQLSRVERQLNQVAKEVADVEEEREMRERGDAAKPRAARARASTRRKRAAAAPKSDKSGSDHGASGDTAA